MCGGIVSFYSGSQSARGTSGASTEARWKPHAAYHLARLAAYASLGAGAGQLGAAFDGIGRHWGLAALGSVLASVTMLLWALPRALGDQRREKLLQVGVGQARQSRWIATLQRRLVAVALSAREKPPLRRAATMGLSSALLPCGWLYAFVVLSAGAGSAWSGAAMLSAFWLGTVPALLGLGLSIERLSRSMRAYLPRLGAVLVMLMAGWNIATRLPVARPNASTTTAPTPSCHAAR
jgi:hypothetical protein